ncbi:hypothetical protein ACG33_11235 [Steroidobacter denitrificans]|uniref:DUF374 domain-containing protein n=2 Tax=Steroidobacter denitrificans TaxID=465721 RepID=A0A127FB64_STEDE|nr:hypothetical protein ACG33_11235 [Steroidobacter denitrificans]
MFGYHLAVWLAAAFIELIWRTARVKVVDGDRLVALIQEHGAVVPTFWHQHLLICSRYLVGTGVEGFKPGFMISPSVDGQAPTMLAELYGAHVVRGSGSYTGVRAVRGVHHAIVKRGISSGITPDGPRGPRFVLKPGAIFTAQITGKPLVPIAYAAKPARLLGTWDKFVLVPPFAKIRIAIGEPYFPPKRMQEAEMQAAQREVERRLLMTFQKARAAL